MLHRNAEEERRPAARLDPETQQRVITLALQLQRRQEELMTVEQLETVAREAGIEPVFVREALARLEKEQRPARPAPDQARLERLRWVCASPGLLGLLSLLAIPTGQAVWLSCLGFLPFLLFVLIPGPMESRWRLRCPECGRSVDIASLGMVRISPAACRPRKLGWCSGCCAPRWLVMEPASAETPAIEP